MLGDRLAKLRTMKRLTQQELADQLKISRATYAQYEINRREPDNETLMKLSEFFGVSIDYLLKGETSTQDVAPEQTEFLKWVDENVDGQFFYDFDRAPEENKRQMMEDLKYLWRRELQRTKRNSD